MGYQVFQGGDMANLAFCAPHEWKRSPLGRSRLLSILQLSFSVLNQMCAYIGEYILMYCRPMPQRLNRVEMRTGLVLSPMEAT